MKQHAASVVRALGAGVLLVSAALVVTVPRAADVGAADDPEMLLERARTASSKYSFRGLLELSWREDGHTKHAKVFARAARGSIELGFDPSRVAARGLIRWVGDETGWRQLWEEPQRSKLPRPGSRWNLAIDGSELVAGRETARLVASDPDTGKPRARFWVEEERGLLLRREILDRAGRVEHSVGFVIIKDLGEVDAPKPPGRALGAPPRSIRRAPDDYPAPSRVGGYRLLSTYDHDDGSLQLFYSDGLFTLSVFEQIGDVDWDTLPDGREHQVEGTRARSYSTATASVVVWGQDGLTITCVGDAPRDEVDGLVQVLHTSDDTDALDDIADFVLGPFGWD